MLAAAELGGARVLRTRLDCAGGETDDPVPRLVAHRDALIAKLRTYREESHVWDKYRWVSEYHNHFCRKNARKEWDLPALLIPDADLAQELHPII